MTMVSWIGTRCNSTCAIKVNSHTKENQKQEDHKKHYEIFKMPRTSKKTVRRQNTSENIYKIITTQSRRKSRKPDWLVV